MGETWTEDAAVARLPSGVAGLDVILCGGFIANGTYILMGVPGAGKTILGNQISFHHVAGGGRVVYVTLLSESHGRMLSHLRSMKFFDPAPISAALTYVSGYRVLEEQGLGGLLELLRKLIRDHRATLLVLDGLVSAEVFAPSELAFKKFIHELNTLVGIVGCTTFLLTNGTAHAVCPEHTMVDGLVELGDVQVGARAARELVVRKFRGSDHLRGRHSFEITSAGLVVRPRLEALRQPAAGARELERASFGEASLDAMLGGGVARGSTTLVLGSLGAGKTTIGLQFLVAGADGAGAERGVYLGFHEPAACLPARGDALGASVRAHVATGTIALMSAPPGDAEPDALAEELLGRVRTSRVRRIFLDGLEAFLDGLTHPDRAVPFFAALVRELRGLDATTVVSMECGVGDAALDAGIDGRRVALAAHADNALIARQAERGAELRRELAVLKTDSAGGDGTIRELLVGERGVRVGKALDAPRPKGRPGGRVRG